MVAKAMPSLTISKPCGCGNLMVTLVFREDGTVFKVRPKLGRNGTCASAIVASVGKLASLALKNGATLGDVAKKIEGVTCHQVIQPMGDDDGSSSCCDAIAKILKVYAEKAKE